MATSVRLLILLGSVIAMCSAADAQSSLNVNLVTQYHRGDAKYSGSWVYVAPDGTEYALLGAQTGTAIYQMLADTVQEVAFFPGPVTTWREITVVGHHAYVVTDVQGENHGMQVIDLSGLPQNAELVTTYTATFTKGHIIQRDIFSEAPYVYVCGTTATQGVHIMDVSDPANPVQAGLYQPGYYIHDCHVRGNLLYGAAFYQGTIDVVDITDKTQPTLITRITIPGGYTHSSSLTADGQYLFIAPERDGLPARMYWVGDPENAYEVAQYSGNYASLVHNPYILGDFAFISHNTEGLRVVDIADPTTPVEVGYYDTYAGASGGFKGLWSACPYLPSGRIIGGNREDGLWVWDFNGARAGRFYIWVRDALSGAPIGNALAIVAQTSDTLHSNPSGQIRGGYLSGDYSIEISAQGYHAQNIELVLQGSQMDSLWVDLTPLDVQTDDQSQTSTINCILSPNPASDLLTVDITRAEVVDALMLYDSKGQLLEIKNGPFSRAVQWDISALSTGWYAITLIAGHEKLVSKMFFKQ